MARLAINTYPYTFKVNFSSASVQKNISLLYPDALIHVSPNFNCDFHVEVKSRRIWGIPVAQSVFSLDGFQPFAPGALQHAPAILEWGMNWCVARHIMQYQIFHAATVANEAGAVLLCGDSGSGKSTLACAMMAKGWRLLTDELSLFDASTFSIIPFVRPVSIKEKAIEVLKTDYANELFFGAVAKNTTKGTVSHVAPTQRSWDHMYTPATPKVIFFPKFNPNAINVRVEPISDAFMIQLLSEQSFNLNTLGASAVKSLVEIVRRIRAYSIEYSDLNAAEERISGIQSECC